jgi:hypothetical protein
MTATDMSPLTWLGTNVKAAWNKQRDEREQNRGAWKPRAVYASRWHRCTRKMAMDIACYDRLPDREGHQLERMQMGVDMEEPTADRLRRAGKLHDPPFEFSGQQVPFEIRGTKGQIIITGRIDGWIVFQAGPLKGKRIPVEFKYGDSVRRVKNLDDFKQGTWTCHMPFQLLAYCYGHAAEHGVLFARNPGEPAIVPLSLMEGLDDMTDFLDRAEEAVEAAAAYEAAINSGPSKMDDNEKAKNLQATMPPCIEDPAACVKCDHYKQSCFPPMTFGEGVKVLTPEDTESLESDLEIMESTEQAAKDFKSAKDRVAKKVRGMPQVMCGKFLAGGKWQQQTKYNIPKEVKEEYKEVKQEGKWMLAWERIGPAEDGEPSRFVQLELADVQD